ncbi:MAG: hypothetical protein J6T87_10405 [Bacteroidales bacterium]|nr:hypothetical protein [Bacteroidales bacterium]MCR4964504.1 hypothetical protein [Bacteroidales bacterium]
MNKEEAKQNKILVFDECKNYGRDEFVGFIMYCIYKNEWVEYQKKHPNWSTDDKLNFQNSLTPTKFQKYQDEANRKIEAFIGSNVKKQLDELNIQLIKKFLKKCGKFFKKGICRFFIQLFIGVLGSFLAVALAMYAKEHWEWFMSLINNVSV